ncbi:MAG: TRAP transporter large permease subunit [Oscillibacter sp.]|nr:TRAP transporter large permease subunit [Oscillibacter sp.]
MSILLNPVLVSVIVLCLLCLCKLNVLMSLILAALTGAVLAGISIPEAMTILCDGFGANAGTALAYIFLGTFASAVAGTGLADMMSKKLSRVMGKSGTVLLLVLAAVACLSQNLIPVHIAFIPIMIPPMLSLFNELKVDRRVAACSLAFGLKAPYICIPFGFGAIFMGIIADNMTANGMSVTISDVARYNWILGLAMFAGLLIAVFATYHRPRAYEARSVDTSMTEAVSDKLTKAHIVTLIAIVAVVAVQVLSESLALSALCGVLVMILGGAIPWKQVDENFASGIRLMGMIAMIMLVAGGYAEVMKATGAVNELVEAAIVIMGGSKWIAAVVITLIGLLVTMGIGSSFSTVPVLAVLYVPLCSRMGFSPAATILLMSAAAALGDAGSPASDTTLGPTSGLNADGQHDHIWDTCVPTFLHFNIPLMLVSIVVSQFI